MTQSVDPVLGTRTLTYTSYNMLASVTRGSNTLNFVYGPEHGRVKETRVVAGVTTTVYFVHPDNAGGLLYEKEISGARTYHKHYINAPGGVVAVVTTGSSNLTEYWHKDHLGSVAVMTGATGVVVGGSRRAFDPWGKSSVAGDGFRGFTSHEQFETFGIIHMNGRVYDARLGRFMSADPTVQYPGHLQNYNRYSYIDNNPLSAADMSGYGFLTSFFKMHSIITGEKWTLHPIIQKYPWVGQIGIAAAAIGCSFVGAGPACAAAASAYNAYILGGSDWDIFMAGAIAGATAFAYTQIPEGWAAWSFERFAAHAAIGCASGAASGSGCGRGAASAIAGKFASNVWGDPPGKFSVGGFVASVVAGGTVSVIGGGKFGNGALTGAFGYLFNQAAGQILTNPVTGRETDCGGLCTPEMGWANTYGTPEGDKAVMMGYLTVQVGIPAGLAGFGVATVSRFVVIGTKVELDALGAQYITALGAANFVGPLGNFFYQRLSPVANFANTVWNRFSAWRGDVPFSVTRDTLRLQQNMLGVEVRGYEKAGTAVRLRQP